MSINTVFQNVGIDYLLVVYLISGIGNYMKLIK